ncbi:zinc ribbon domain-containing protein [Patescibacteria group bacterium]|nr:zinc ribbon domain-containing protein [Patescibacteria group bacterium]
MKTCIACSMPITNDQELGADTKDGSVCVHCYSNGEIKSRDEIFEGGVQFFIGAIPGTDRELAEKLVRKNMNSLTYWQKNPCDCLQGPQASEEEFKEALSKFQQK